jgi:O-acetyl-ADP-ribose deacetylase (regulator of RNase III)
MSLDVTTSSVIIINYLKNINLALAIYKHHDATPNHVFQVAEDTYILVSNRFTDQNKVRVLMLAIDECQPDQPHFFLVEGVRPSTLNLHEISQLKIEFGSVWDTIKFESLPDGEIVRRTHYQKIDIDEIELTLEKQFLDMFENARCDLTENHITFFQIESESESDDPLSYIIGDIGHINDLLQGKQRLDPIAVVNAANSHLSTGGGVTGALVRGVGGSLNWNQITQQATYIDGSKPDLKNGLETGDAVWTPTLGLLQKDNVQVIIHTLGPIAGQEPIQLIAKTIDNVMKLADHLKIKTLILPAISGGIFATGHPTWATEIRQLILKSLTHYMITHPKTSIRKVYLISYSQEDQNLWPEP